MSVQEIQPPQLRRVGYLATTPSTDERHRETTVSTHCSQCGSINGKSPSQFTTSPNSTHHPPPPDSNETPEKKIAAVLRRAISDMSSLSFQEALASVAPQPISTPPPPPHIRRAVSDVTSNVFQESLRGAAATPPKSPCPIPNPSQIRRNMSDVTSPSFQDSLKATTPPSHANTFSPAMVTVAPAPVPTSSPLRLRRRRSHSTSPAILEAAKTTVTPPSEGQRTGFSPAGKTGTCTTSSTRAETPHSKRLKKMREMVKEIERKCEEVMRESEEEHEEREQEEVQNASELINGNYHNQEETEEDVTEDESVSMEWTNFGLEIQFKCPCGKGYQVLLTENNCFYKLA